MKVLLATQKPFAAKAVEGIVKILTEAGHEVVKLEKYAEQADFVAAVADVEAIIIRSDKVTAEVIAAAPKLKIVVRAGAGYDNVDLAAATAAGVVVMNTPGQNSNAVAELALGLMIFMARTQFTPATGSELQGKRLGVQAYGNVGRLVGQKAKALGMAITALDPFLTDEQIVAGGAEPVHSVEELYAASDYLSIHIPALPSTIRSIGYDLLVKMPKGATVVNTARKEVIDEDGLLKALEERPDLKYVTDVMPDNYTLLQEKFGARVFATPKKMGAQTAEANINAGLALNPAGRHFFGTLPYLILLFLPLFLFVVLLIIWRKRIQNRENVAQLRNRRANKVARKSLKKAKVLLATGKEEEFYVEISRALWGYMSDKFHIPLADLSMDTVRNRLGEKGVEAEDIEEFVNTLNECEFARFAPNSGHELMNHLYELSLQFITKIEKK